MKTLIALVVFIMAILGIMILAGIIVATLLFWPPCTQIGHNCVVDGWSIAGLAGTVLAVAATMLAVLGAVAVAYWWLTLNERVTEQITKLYEDQKKVVNALVDQLLQVQQQKVDKQLEELRAKFVKVEAVIVQINDHAAQAARNSQEARRMIDEMTATSHEMSELFKSSKEAAEKTKEVTDELAAYAKRIAEILDNPQKLLQMLQEAQLAGTTTPTASEN